MSTQNIDVVEYAMGKAAFGDGIPFLSVIQRLGEAGDGRAAEARAFSFALGFIGAAIEELRRTERGALPISGLPGERT